MTREAIVLALLLSCGSAPLVLAAAEHPKGTWKGSVVRLDGSEFDVVPIVVKLDEDGGTVEYPSLGCRGTLDQIKVSIVDGSVNSVEYGQRLACDRPACCFPATIEFDARTGAIYVVDGSGSGTSTRIGVLRKKRVGDWEKLKELLGDLRNSPRDGALRETIIGHALDLKPAPAIPDEAWAHFDRANVAMHSAGAADAAYELAEREYEEALLVAPWWGNAYYNLAIVLALRGRGDESSRTIEFYRIAASVPDARAVRDEIRAGIEATQSRRREIAREQAVRAKALRAFSDKRRKQEDEVDRETASFNSAVDSHNAKCGGTLSESTYVECRASSLELDEWREHMNALNEEIGELDGAKWYRKAAEEGDAEAQNALGVYYFYGDGVGQDNVEAMRWVRKAADQGYARAQSNVGDLYRIAKDYAEAANWYRKAARQGDAEAQESLGDLCESGEGVTKDFAEALGWYRIAAAQGRPSAQFRMGRYYQVYFILAGLRQDHAEAARWYRKAAEQGHAEAQFSLGSMCAGGKGVAQDHAEAANWYRKAVDQGHAGAQTRLGVMHLSGKGVPKDVSEAMTRLRKAADQGDAYGQYVLGTLYADGKVVAQDYREAMRWLLKAAEQGDASAQYNLGVMYSNGMGVAVDTTTAGTWYRRAKENGNEDARKALEDLEAGGRN